MQHTSGIPNATGVHRHVDDLLLDRGGVTDVAVIQQESTSVAYLLLATIALLALLVFPCRMISVPWQWGQCRTCIIMLSLGWLGGCSASHTPRENSRPTPLKHPPPTRQLGRQLERLVGTRDAGRDESVGGATFRPRLREENQEHERGMGW